MVIFRPQAAGISNKLDKGTSGVDLNRWGFGVADGTENVPEASCFWVFFSERLMNGWFIGSNMQKSDFTVHLSPKEMIKMAELTLKFSTLSRNAIIKECINAYVLEELKTDEKDFKILCLETQVNALHIQLNPDWKRKKSLPFPDPRLYVDISNYSVDLPPNGGDE
jgi:hypothetical protein